MNATRLHEPSTGIARDPARTRGVTVVLGSYNGAAHLREQLASIAAQTLPPDALLVGDDGSTDATLEIVAAFARTSPIPVRVHRHPHLGITGNFLTTAGAVRTEWTAWSDQDDVWHPDKLQHCIELAERQQAVLAFHDVEIVDAQLRPMPRVGITSWSAEVRRTGVLPRFEGRQWECFNGFATVFRSDLLVGVDWRSVPAAWAHPGRLFHDETVHELARLRGRRVVIAERLAQYRQHDASATGDVSAPGLRRRIDAGRAQYEARDRTAADLARWVRELPGLRGDRAVLRHVDRVARDQRIRLGVYASSTRTGRLRALLAGITHRSYRRRGAGGHGVPGLAKDAVVVLRG